VPVRVCFWGVQHGLATGDYVQFIMKQKHSGSTLTSAALVLFAGALGSLFTLLVTGNLSVPLVGDVKTGDTQQSAAASQLTEKDVNDVTSDSTLLITDATANSVRTIDDLRKVQEQMRVALEDATAERSQLAQTIRQLTVQVENLESDSINFQSLSELNSTIDSPQDAANAALTNNGSPESNSERRIGNLVAAGVDYNNALSIQARQDQYQLERLRSISVCGRAQQPSCYFERHSGFGCRHCRTAGGRYGYLVCQPAGVYHARSTKRYPRWFAR